MITKEKLLQTKAFIDNSQLENYITLINNAQKAKYTEKHHIIPRSYFKLTKQKIDNSKNNIVKLSYFDHILAHYYLSFCTCGKLKQANISAFIMLVDTGIEILSEPEIVAIQHIKGYAELKEATKLDKQIKCKKLGSKPKTDSHRQALSKSRDLHATTKNKKAIYNKELNKVKFIDINNLQNYLNNGWVLSGKPLSTEAKQKISKSNSEALRGKHHQVHAEGKIWSGLASNKVICLETNMIFENIEAAKRWLQETVGIDGSQIKNCCAGARETTGGYHWQYYKED